MAKKQVEDGAVAVAEPQPQPEVAKAEPKPEPKLFFVDRDGKRYPATISQDNDGQPNAKTIEVVNGDRIDKRVVYSGDYIVTERGVQTRRSFEGISLRDENFSTRGKQYLVRE